MRLQDKIAINNMRLEGYSPSVIATTLGLPQSTVRSHIYRHPGIPDTKNCKQCGKSVLQPKRASGEKVLFGRLPYGMVEQPPGNRKQKSVLCSGV